MENIAGLGYLGGAEEAAMLERIMASGPDRLKPAAQAALRRIKQRTGSA